MQRVTCTCPARRKNMSAAVPLILGMTVAILMMVMVPTLAETDYTTTITDIVEEIVGIVGLIFQVVGVVLLIYAIGQLVLAFKNDDANSKSSASTLLVVGVVLIALPQIIEALDLVSMIG